MIGERLAEIRKDHNHTQNDLSLLLNVSLHTVRAWEQGKSSPSHEMLISLCRLYQVSSDYLLGLSDEFSPVETSSVKLTAEERSELQNYQNYLLWKRKM